MKKLKLNPEEKIIFLQALLDAYTYGDKDSTSLFNGNRSLIKGQERSLEEITVKYLEEIKE